MKKLSQKTHSSEQKIKSKTKNYWHKKELQKTYISKFSQSKCFNGYIDESAKSHLSKLEPLEDKKGSENSEKKLFLNNLTDETVQHITNGIQKISRENIHRS
ncbi:unnamed protein product [Pneumocystis jirovecii]|uniref:Uncharacterized protein n=1 Tax=Pneumocystis jirovecii TaxID=42068 RepID=L0PE90_PNEJI|nr:unnamed protein product [Pneumocystis jirovecii]